VSKPWKTPPLLSGVGSDAHSGLLNAFLYGIALKTAIPLLFRFSSGILRSKRFIRKPVLSPLCPRRREPERIRAALNDVQIRPTVPVMVVDDHEIWRDGVRSMLKDTEFEVVGEAASGKEAMEIIADIRPRLVLLDIRMAGGDGFETLMALKGCYTQLSVVMLTTYTNPTFMARAVAGGASGYLLKGVKRQELLTALRTVAEGGILLSREDLNHSLRCVSDNSQGSEELSEPLTPRELEVLRLLATGLSNRDIATLLFIGDGTVKTHVEHIIGKLAVSDRVQAAVWAARQGLVQTL
jgi:DNA-binding NarL/FixJ family response regulator